MLKYSALGVTKEILGKGNVVEIDSSSNYPDLNRVIFRIKGNFNRIEIAKGVTLRDTKVEIHGDYHFLRIEEYCKISGSFLWMEDRQGVLIVGKQTTMEKETKICVTESGSKVLIGEDCMLAYGVVIRSGDSHSIIDLKTNKRINFAGDVRIGNHVWICTSAQILKGVTIGSDSVIAASAVVTKDVPKNSLAAGLPAVVKKKDVMWDRKKLA